MGFLDRIASLVRRPATGPADPKGPLGLMPGDEISYYRKRFRVTGIRVVQRKGCHVFHYRLLGLAGGLAVLSARDTDVETWMLETVLQDADMDWNAERQTGPEGDLFKLAGTGQAPVRQYGETGYESAKQVSWRRFLDADEEQTLILEDYGVGREVRVGDPIYEGELRFEADVTAAENRPWATAAAEKDAAAVLENESDVSRGSTVAAALALEGRFVSDDVPNESFSNTDPFEYADQEWADARDVVPEPQALPGSVDAPNDPRAEWLTPTFWIAGSHEPSPVEVEDDWLTREAS